MHNIKNKNRFLIKSSSIKPSESRIFRNNLSSYLPKNDPKRESSIVRDSLPLTIFKLYNSHFFSFPMIAYLHLVSREIAQRPEKIILSLTEDPTEKAWIRAWPSGSSF